jgi:RluA family pseudouridine synthase
MSAESTQHQDQAPDILFRSPSLLVVNKPGGLLTQAPPGIDSLEVRMKRWAKAESTSEKPPYIGVPHRLDRPVSGAILFALDKQTTQQVCRQFEQRDVVKKYWALVEGDCTGEHFPAKTGSLSDYMRKIPGQAMSEIVHQDAAGAQFALLNYRILQPVAGFTWLEIELETGRTHQIRLQLAARGVPIIGDALYGARIAFGELDPDERKRSIALHARYLRLQHPQTKDTIRIEAPLPNLWNDFAGIL